MQLLVEIPLAFKTADISTKISSMSIHVVMHANYSLVAILWVFFKMIFVKFVFDENKFRIKKYFLIETILTFVLQYICFRVIVTNIITHIVYIV